MKKMVVTYTSGLYLEESSLVSIHFLFFVSSPFQNSETVPAYRRNDYLQRTFYFFSVPYNWMQIFEDMIFNYKI